jgi:shikimate dehydrogenase
MALEYKPTNDDAPEVSNHYCVFGNPINHSKSPVLHTLFADQTHQHLTYTSECIDVGGFSSAAKDFFSSGGKGLNVTVPFKHDAYIFATSLTARAIRAGAVNTLFVNKRDVIVGDNTDGIGLVADLKQHLQWQLNDKKILILGAGGAVRGILEPLIDELPRSITIVNRSREKAQLLANDFADIFSVAVTSYPELNNSDDLGSYDLIINASSASLSGQLPDLPDHIVDKNSRCYDLMYAKVLTPFLFWAEAKGCVFISDGLGMLVCQGAESFFIWRGVKPKTAEVIRQLRHLL